MKQATWARVARISQSVRLRFSANLEHDFKRSLERELAASIYLVCAVCMVSQLHGFFNMMHLAFDDPVLEVTIVKKVCIIFMNLIVVFITLRRAWISRHVCAVDLELLFVVMNMIAMPLVAIGKGLIAQLLERDRSGLLPGGDASLRPEMLGIMIVSANSMLCCVIPMRSHIRWILPVWCSIVFVTLCYGIPSPEERAHFPIVLVYLVVTSGMSFFGGFRCEAHRRKEWLAERQVDKQTHLLQKHVDAVNKLLHCFSDCLIQLGPNLEVLHPSKSLAAMLFFSDASDLQGCCFSDYLASENDRNLFKEAMSNAATPEQSSPGILPLHLRDVYNREVHVHAYFVSFLDQNDAPYHIIGIVEDSEQRQDMEEPVVRHDIIDRRSDSVRPSSSGSLGSGSSHSTSNDTLALEPVTGSDLGEVSLTIDSSPKMKIVSCTQGFTALCGAITHEASFLELLGGNSVFVAYVQSFVQLFTFTEHYLELRPPSAGRAGLEYSIKHCTVKAVTLAGVDGPESKLFFQINLSDISERRRSNRKRHVVPSHRQRRILRL